MCVDLALIYDNEHFDSKAYPNFYLFLLIFTFVAIILWLVYLIAPDSKGTRSLVPWAFLLFAVSLIFIGIWCCIYIFYKYPDHPVYIRDWNYADMIEDGGGDSVNQPSYHTESKGWYIFWNGLLPIITGALYFWFYLKAVEWQGRHSDSDRAED